MYKKDVATHTSTIRCMSSDNRAKFSAMLSAVRWETMFRMRSCEEQFTFYQTVIDQLMCRCFPNKVVTRHSADKPWVTDAFRALVRKRQRAQMCGDITQARLFRNKVKRAAVRLRKEFYQAKVTTLSESSTREWWRHMKSLIRRIIMLKCKAWQIIYVKVILRRLQTD